MQSFDIYIPRELFENGFKQFSEKSNKPIWSIYGTGGIGKSTLMRDFQEKILKENTPMCFIDYSEYMPEKITGLDVLLYYSVSSNCHNFDKIKKIIERKYKAFSEKLSRISETAEGVPVKSISELIKEIDKDAAYTEELGLVWRTLVDTVKVASNVFKRDQKKDQVSSNPELHLFTALLADIEKHKAGFLLVDTFEKLKGVRVSTTLQIIGKQLVLAKTEYEVSFKEYLSLMITYLYEQVEKARIKTILAGRLRINEMGNFNLLHIQHNEVNKFELSQIFSYFERVAELIPDFPLPATAIVEEIEQLTKGNPLILHFLVQFILARYGEAWDWDEWQYLKPAFQQSEDENGLLYYLTNRIATHISGWEDSL
ncbi:MAG: hypothetical protein ACK4TA_07245 [Saprospiraceae bacterium]